MCIYGTWPWEVPKWPWFWHEVAVKAFRDLATLCGVEKGTQMGGQMWGLYYKPPI
jgi:hypothetical protein